MITILCSPKPFEGEAAWNQMNAMRSWRAIHPDIEIIVFGEAVGSFEAAMTLNANYIPKIECSSSGAPSFNAMTWYAHQNGQFDHQLYVNCDILLDHSILTAFTMVADHFEKFLLVGERLDLAEGEALDVRCSNWTGKIAELAGKGKVLLHGPTGVDFFGFKKGIWDGLPPVYMGRAFCDNALLHHCLKRSIPIIDGTLAVRVVHQFHGYGHVKGGRKEVFNGIDRNEMIKAHGLKHSLPTITDANWRFSANGKIQQNNCRRSFLRRLELIIRYRLGMEWLAIGIRALQYILGKRIVKTQNLSIEKVLTSQVRFK